MRLKLAMTARSTRGRVRRGLGGLATVLLVTSLAQLPALAAFPPTFAIDDVAVLEGDAGTNDAVFTVTRADDLSATNTVEFTTTGGTATAGVDYTTTAGTLTFAPGESTATITVPVVGDTTTESDEAFTVVLSNPSNGAVFADASGTGTILDDELPITLHGGGPGSGSDFIANNTQGTSNGLPTGGTCNSSPGLGIADATLDPAGTSPRGAQGDAYDNGFNLFVDNSQFVAPATVSATASGTRADSLQAGPTTLSGLDVTMQYKALQTSAVLRTIATFANPSTGPISVPVIFETNNGSDGSTGVRGTSDGDTTVTTADRWIVTSDNAGTASDPVNTHVLAGPGTPAVTPSAIVTTIYDCAGTEGIQGTFDITVPAGATRSLMFFNGLNQTNAEALTEAPALYSTNPAPTGVLVNDLSVAQLSQLLNWSLAPLDVTKVADAATSTPGATNGYTVTVANPNQDPVDLDSISDTLSAGFTYVAGSSTFGGSPIADPSNTSGTLTWTGPFTLPAAASGALHFNVTVPSTDGTSTNSATAAAAGYTVVAATDVAPVQVKSPPPSGPTGSTGYRMVAADGGIFTFGDRGFHGSLGDKVLNKPIVGGATNMATFEGYYMVGADGGVFTFGDAPFFGSMAEPGKVLDSVAVDIEETPTGKGYWIVSANGHVYNFGDAGHFGDARTLSLNQQIIAITITPSGKGYWLVGRDGGIFSFGDAEFFGSMGGTPLNAPVIDLGSTPDGNGYYLAAKDGGIFTFGNAEFRGSTGSLKLNQPVIAMLVSATGTGYWLTAGDGGIFTFGDLPFHGSMGNVKLNAPVLDIIS